MDRGMRNAMQCNPVEKARGEWKTRRYKVRERCQQRKDGGGAKFSKYDDVMPRAPDRVRVKRVQ